MNEEPIAAPARTPRRWPRLLSTVVCARSAAAYVALIVRRLSGARFYEQSREENAQGLVVARLTIGQDGRLLALSLARSSGFPGRDRSVSEAIRRAAPFPPLPSEIGGKS